MELRMGLRKAGVVGLIAGLAMGLSLFVVGAIASRKPSLRRRVKE